MRRISTSGGLLAGLGLGVAVFAAVPARAALAFYGVGTPQAFPAGPAIFSDVSASGRTLLGYEFVPEGIRSFVVDVDSRETSRLPGLSPDSEYEVLVGLGDGGRTAVGYGDRSEGGLPGRSSILVNVPSGPATNFGTPVSGFDERRVRDLSENGTTFVGWNVPLDEQEAFYAFRGAEDELRRVPFDRGDIVSSIATHVSDAGNRVVGEVLTNGNSFAFRYRLGDDRAEVFGFDAAGIEDVSVVAVTGDARFVAGTGFDGRNRERAIRLDLDAGSARVLSDAFAGLTASRATGVSADGRFVIGEVDTGWTEGEFGRDAAVWEDDRSPVLMTDWLAAAGLAEETAGWRLTGTRVLSGDGRVITGFGLRPDGLVQAWVAVVPEPAAGCLLLLVGAGALGRRRAG